MNPYYLLHLSLAEVFLGLETIHKVYCIPPLTGVISGLERIHEIYGTILDLFCDTD